VKERIGPIGIWLGWGLGIQPASVERELVAELEELGYGALWLGEFGWAREPFTHAGLLLAASRRIVVATGIASIWARDATATAGASLGLAEAYPGRFLLGLGVSHQFVVESRGHDYIRPVARMSSYLDELDAVDYRGPAPDPALTRVLAALRPPMLELARTRADGAHPYFVPVEHTARAREILGPDSLLAPEQFVLLETDPSEARRVAREHMALYLAAPNYTANLRWLGWDDADLSEGGSDKLVDAIVAWGDENAIRGRIQAHLEAGADHVCVQPLGRTPGDVGVEQLRRLAPVLLT
jgi:probable F420-dependent oxidoreductase